MASTLSTGDNLSLRPGWGWLLGLGILMILLGSIALWPYPIRYPIRKLVSAVVLIHLFIPSFSGRPS
jgi:hypothetical protein